MLTNYLKIAGRNLRKNLSYSVINVLGLGSGIAGAALIFLFLQFHLSTDRHQPHFQQVYRVVLNLLLDEGIEYEPGSSLPLAAALAKDYAQVEKSGFVRKLPNTTISSLQGSDVRRFLEKDNVVLANRDFMEMFLFEGIDSNVTRQMNEPATVIITEKVARKYFKNAEVTGKVLRLDNSVDLKIVGVVKDQTRPTDLNFDIFISLPTLKNIEPSFETDNFGWLSGRNLTFVRLSEGSNAMTTQRSLNSNGKKYYGDVAKYYDHKLQPLADMHFDARYDGKINLSVLWILGGVGIFLVVIACINFVNLATAQALKRGKEIGIRKVLGSTYKQIFWQFISETALVTFASSLLALMLVALLLPMLNNWTHSYNFRLAMLFQLELLYFWLIAVVAVVFCAGFYPAVIISGFNPVVALKSKLSTQQVGGIGLRRILITVQLVIAQVLVIGTLVLIFQLRFFMNADLGFDKNTVITLTLPKAAVGQGMTYSLRTELMQYPEVKSVSYQYEAPTSSMGYGGSVRFDNRVEWEKFVIRDRFGDANYLNTYKMSLLSGRNFSAQDSVVEFVVNAEFMKKLGIREPHKILGRQMEDGNSGLKGEIVGVVKNFHLKSLQEAIEPCVIFAKPSLYKEVAVKLETKDLPKSINQIRRAWMKRYPEEVFTYQFVDEQIEKFYEKEQDLASLIRTFSFAGIFICCLGLFGMVSFLVSQKTKEIGVRKVLGAGVLNIVSLFSKEFLALAFTAFIIALPLSWYLMRNWLAGFAYRIELDWWLFASGGALIMLITMLTVGWKVAKAAIMDPVKSLRAE